ncbi:MAG: GldG family protein [Desulfomonile sp.]|nr:GldG family protein [Desulfomonile sp.]
MGENRLRRQFLLGGGATTGIIVFLAIVVAIQYVVVQHPKRWDITRLGKYTLASQSKQALLDFKYKDIPIEVLAFYEAKDFNERERVRDLLDQYRDVYSRFTYSFIDPDMSLMLAKQHSVESYPTLVIKAGDKQERITSVDEETLTNTLLKMLRTEVKKVYLVKGHGELAADDREDAGFSVAKQQIEKQNYTTAELVLTQVSAVPDDANIVVIAGPTADPLDSEIDLLRAYINRGGHLLVLLNPFKTPKLTEFLKNYGFEFADDIVVDRLSRVFGGDYLMPVITQYVKFPITKNFKLASFFPEARSVRVPKETKPEISAQELALTSPVSWTIGREQLQSGDANFDEKTGMRGPVPVMAVSTYTTTVLADASRKEKASEAKGETESKNEADESNKAGASGSQDERAVKARIVVLGSSQFASNKFFKLEGNADLFMNTVSWLAEEENLIAIRPKSERARPLILTASQSRMMFLVPVVFVPLAWFVVGVVVYIHRRRTASA